MESGRGRASSVSGAANCSVAPDLPGRIGSAREVRRQLPGQPVRSLRSRSAGSAGRNTKPSLSPCADGALGLGQRSQAQVSLTKVVSERSCTGDVPVTPKLISNLDSSQSDQSHQGGEGSHRVLPTSHSISSTVHTVGACCPVERYTELLLGRIGALRCILAYVPVGDFPCFQRISKSCCSALNAHLDADETLRLQLDKHKKRELKQKLSRPWVGVRIKPGGPGQFQHGLDVDGASISMDADKVVVSHSDSRRQHQCVHKERANFFFDSVFNESSSQSTVWCELEYPLLSCIRAHRHACVMAYGQTGSGKTYTMFGDGSCDGEGIAFRAIRRIADSLREERVVKLPPVVPLTWEGLELVGRNLAGAELARIRFSMRPVRELREELADAFHVNVGKLSIYKGSALLQDHDMLSDASGNDLVVHYNDPRAQKPLLEFSFLEVYNESIYDLLQGGEQLPQTRETANSVIPQGTTKNSCSLDDMETKFSEWLLSGARARTVGETVFNPQSSRSHAVATIYINWNPDCERRVYLVDLAGSERAGRYAISDEQLREGNSINHSLSTLGRVVSAVAAGRGEHVPVRDSALTWLLSDAIVGNLGKSFLLAAVSPASELETFTTLRYAKQFSTLQARGGLEVARLGKNLRLLEAQLSCLKNDLQEMSKKCRIPVGWTHESLKRGGGVRPTENAEEIMRAVPGPEWTQEHSRVSQQEVGVIQREIEGGVVEVVYAGMRRKEALVLLYPRDALQRAHPPRYLAPITELVVKLDAVRAQIDLTRQQMVAEKEAWAREYQRLKRGRRH